MINRSRFCLTLLAALIMSTPVMAQTSEKKEPLMPAPLETMSKEGAQVRYMGNRGGLDGWIAIQNGQEQYFYATADREFVLLGLLFDKSGKMVTLEQVSALQKEGGAVLDILKADTSTKNASVTDTLPGEGDIAKSLKSPSEQMFSDVEGGNWLAMGNQGAPILYTFMDPQCPYCHEFMKTLRPEIEGGRIQVRLIPVGFHDETRAQAALLLAAPNAQDRWFRHLDGDKDALPVTPGVNEQGVERNMAIMQSWKLNVTPLSVYRAQDGKVKIIQGRAKDMKALLSDLKVTP